MSFTSGPWKVERRFSNGCEVVPRITCAPDSDRGCGWIADIIGAPYLGHESTLPNAYLIAAAPNLYHACREMLANIDHWLITGNPAESKRLHDLMEAAVEKADGKGAGE